MNTRRQEKDRVMQGTGPDLRAVVYVSVSTKRMTREALEALLIEARMLNRASGVTGVLLCSDDQFMQYFEGPTASINVTYDRIRASRGHTGIVEMLNEPVQAREFPEWEMGFAQPAPSELVALSTAAWLTQDTLSVARGRTSMGMKILRDFWRRQSEWR